MKIKLLSDLHIEFKVKLYEQEYFQYNGEDVLVLAGDIHSGATNVINVLKAFLSAGFPKIIYVPGNHEYYRGLGIDHFDNALNAFAKKEPRVSFLNPGYSIVSNTLFIGATLWTNFQNDPFAEISAKSSITDFKVIPEFTTTKCIYKNLKDMAYIKDSYRLFKENKFDHTYIVTHFLPCKEAISPYWQNSGGVLNKYFANDETEFISGLENVTWLFGHTHDQVNTLVGNTRLIANPKGYPMGFNNFNPKCYV